TAPKYISLDIESLTYRLAALAHQPDLATRETKPISLFSNRPASPLINLFHSKILSLSALSNLGFTTLHWAVFLCGRSARSKSLRVWKLQYRCAGLSSCQSAACRLVQARKPATRIIVIDIPAFDCSNAINNLSGVIEFKR